MGFRRPGRQQLEPGLPRRRRAFPSTDTLAGLAKQAIGTGRHSGPRPDRSTLRYCPSPRLSPPNQGLLRRAIGGPQGGRGESERSAKQSRKLARSDERWNRSRSADGNACKPDPFRFRRGRVAASRDSALARSIAHGPRNSASGLLSVPRATGASNEHAGEMAWSAAGFAR